MNGIEQEILDAKLDILKRNIRINILVSEYSKQKVGFNMNPLWKQALLITRDLSRHTIFSTYVDLMSYGNEDYQSLALMLIAKQRVYFLDHGLYVELLADQELKSKTNMMISNIQSALYEERYKRTH